MGKLSERDFVCPAALYLLEICQYFLACEFAKPKCNFTSVDVIQNTSENVVFCSGGSIFEC